MILFVGTVILPLVYFVPRTTLWVIRGWVTWRALRRGIILFGLWAAAFLLIPVAVERVVPSLASFVSQNIGWMFGQSLGFVVSVIRVVVPGGRDALMKDYESWVRPFLTRTGVARLGAMAKAT